MSTCPIAVPVRVLLSWLMLVGVALTGCASDRSGGSGGFQPRVVQHLLPVATVPQMQRCW
jgi:hypothetical protein